MTTTPTLTGQDIGQAEKATRAVLDRLLARTGSGFHGWVILNQLSAAGGVMDAAGLASRVSHGLKISPADVQDALSELGGQHLVSEAPPAGGAAQVTLTPAAGPASHRYRLASARSPSGCTAGCPRPTWPWPTRCWPP